MTTNNSMYEVGKLDALAIAVRIRSDKAPRTGVPTKPGHTWVEDRRVEGGGYFRKLPPGKKDATKVGKVGAGTATGGAIAAGFGLAAIAGLASTAKKKDVSALGGLPEQGQNGKLAGVVLAGAGGIGAGIVAAKNIKEIREEEDANNIVEKAIAQKGERHPSLDKPITHPISDYDQTLYDLAKENGKEITYGDVQSIQGYAAQDYSLVNRYLAAQTNKEKAALLKEDSRLESKIYGLDIALSKLPELHGEQSVISGVKYKKDELEYSEVKFKDIPHLNRYVQVPKGAVLPGKGEVFSEPRLVSTTTQQDSGLSRTMRTHFEKNPSSQLIVYRIRPKEVGTNARYLGNDPKKDESEVLFKPNSSFRVEKVEKTDLVYTAGGMQRQRNAHIYYLQEI
jgi:hypothetical protein